MQWKCASKGFNHVSTQMSVLNLFTERIHLFWSLTWASLMCIPVHNAVNTFSDKRMYQDLFSSLVMWLQHIPCYGKSLVTVLYFAERIAFVLYVSYKYA